MHIRIVVAAHKPYWMPQSPLYLPVQAGSASKAGIGFTRDDQGEHISEKNPLYCELTALYWAWKNLPCDYLGLAHYRRHFSAGRPLWGGGERKDYVLRPEQAEAFLRKEAILLPPKRRYFIESRCSHFAHAHGRVELEGLRALLESDFPDFLLSFDRVMRRTSGHIFNMFIMRRDIADAWCAWLFAVLFRLEAQLAKRGIVPQARIFGFLAERLLDVWLEARALPYAELPTLMLEPPNWPLKIAAFLRRKVRGGIEA